MPRNVLDASRIHPSVRQTVADHHRHMVDRVEVEIAKHPVLVVGMALNPMPKKARAALDAAGIAHGYVEFGSYFNTWRERNALKMWSGWPTFRWYDRRASFDCQWRIEKNAGVRSFDRCCIFLHRPAVFLPRLPA